MKRNTRCGCYEVVHPGKSGQAVGCKTVSAEREITRMNMHKNARLMPQGQLLLVQRVLDQGWPVAAAASAAGLSQRQAYRWLARYRAGGTAALMDRSSAPRRCPHEVPAARVAEIEHWRRQRLSGPAIARQLAMPVSTVGGRLRRLGLGKLAALEPRPPVVRYQRERPGELLHIDTKKLGRIEAIGHRITGDRRDSRRGAGWEAVHVCIDDASRLAYSEVLPDERKTSAVSFLERAVAWFAGQGVTVERVMTDNGSAYRQPSLAPRLRRARAASPSHPAVHAADQRQGRALHPDQSARVGVCAPLCELARAHRRAQSLARPLQHRPAACRPGPPAARHPSASIGVPRFDRRRRSSVPTCDHRRPVRRVGARSAAGDRRQPARSVLAAARRTGHAPTGGRPMRRHLNNVRGNDN